MWIDNNASFLSVNDFDGSIFIKDLTLKSADSFYLRDLNVIEIANKNEEGTGGSNSQAYVQIESCNFYHFAMTVNSCVVDLNSNVQAMINSCEFFNNTNANTVINGINNVQISIQNTIFDSNQAYASFVHFFFLGNGLELACNVLTKH